MLGWMMRCLPGLSIIVLLVLLLGAFTDSLGSASLNRPYLPSKIKLKQQEGTRVGLGIAQCIFITYTMLIHLNMFGFTCRLAWSIYRATGEANIALNGSFGSARLQPETAKYIEEPASRISVDTPDSPDEKSNRHHCFGKNYSEDELVHAIILPNYREDMRTLETTLRVLASHPHAKAQYEVYLAMEQNEESAADKAAHLVSLFEKSFLSIRWTLHPAGVPGEIAGKSSNVAFAARHIMEIHHADLKNDCCNVVVTVMDADTHLSRSYFAEICRLHYSHFTEAACTIYCCPIIFDRNAHETPAVVRCADLLWAFAGLSTMHPGSLISIPTSVYSLPLSLAERVGGWDSDPTAIGEDMHMLLKCYFETGGSVISRVVHVPASQCNVSSDRPPGWRHTVDTCTARYRQALRHMWGALDSGFATRRTLCYLRFNKRCLFLRPRHFALIQLLWEAHFLPCHLTILLVFSVVYTAWVPKSEMHPTLVFAFSLTDALRTMSFVCMNVCLVLYERWHAICLNARIRDMQEANLPDTGYAQRIWYKPQFLVERICFPIAGAIYGTLPTLHAVFAHFWTDRLTYRVSKKPRFNQEVANMA